MKFCPGCNSTFDAPDWLCPRCGYSTSVIGDHLSFAPEMARDNTGFRPEYFRELSELEARNFWFCARNQLIIWAMQKYFPDARNFLEIGCGTGFVLSGISRSLPLVRLSGSEIFSDGLGFAGSRLTADVKLFQMDARRIPFRSEFDVIGGFDVLEHIEEDEEVLGQMYMAANKGGGIMLTVPQHQFLWSQQDAYACHVRRYQAGDLKEKLRRAGFTVERTTSFVSLLLPLLFLARWRKRKTNENFDALNELRIGGLANTVLESLMNIERMIIRLGVSFPMGGSLLLIARKN